MATEEAIDDIETKDKEYCFSDGIGIISNLVAEKVYRFIAIFLIVK